MQAKAATKDISQDEENYQRVTIDKSLQVVHHISFI
jgi:hypothetical protein